MGQTTTTFCDRCKKETGIVARIEFRAKAEHIAALPNWQQPAGVTSEDLDLCEPCQGDFEEWAKLPAAEVRRADFRRMQEEAARVKHEMEGDRHEASKLLAAVGTLEQRHTAGKREVEQIDEQIASAGASLRGVQGAIELKQAALVKKVQAVLAKKRVHAEAIARVRMSAPAKAPSRSGSREQHACDPVVGKRRQASANGRPGSGPLLEASEVAEILAVSVPLLARWRKKNDGPPWFQLPGTTKAAGVRYSEAALDDYIEAATVDPAAK